MPHLHVEYSANLETEIDMAAFCEVLRGTAAGLDVFPMAGVRVRAFRADHFSIADGDPKHGFIDIELRLREGRDQAVKEAAAEAVFAAAKAFVAPVMARRSLALSLEMRDIDASLSPKSGTIRDHL